MWASGLGFDPRLLVQMAFPLFCVIGSPFIVIPLRVVQFSIQGHSWCLFSTGEALQRRGTGTSAQLWRLREAAPAAPQRTGPRPQPVLPAHTSSLHAVPRAALSCKESTHCSGICGAWPAAVWAVWPQDLAIRGCMWDWSLLLKLGMRGQVPKPWRSLAGH